MTEDIAQCPSSSGVLGGEELGDRPWSGRGAGSGGDSQRGPQEA